LVLERGGAEQVQGLCTAALLLDVDPVGLGADGPAKVAGAPLVTPPSVLSVKYPMHRGRISAEESSAAKNQAHQVCRKLRREPALHRG
jgi:hypothetical protein